MTPLRRSTDRWTYRMLPVLGYGIVVFALFLIVGNQQDTIASLQAVVERQQETHEELKRQSLRDHCNVLDHRVTATVFFRRNLITLQKMGLAAGNPGLADYARTIKVPPRPTLPLVQERNRACARAATDQRIRASHERGE